MNPQNQQKREIKFSSQKNSRLLVVNSEAAMSIASELESNSSVISYQPNWPLEGDVLSRISHVDIRASYFQKAWTTDFRLILTGGVPAIREIATLNDLSYRASLEKLELSRRYWELVGVTNWKIIIAEE